MEFSYLLLFIVVLVLGVGAQALIKRSYKKWSKVQIQNGQTGATAARNMLDREGLTDVAITAIPGELTDHYDPRTNSLGLSEKVYYGTSVAATAIASHEAGHAVQHARAYVPAKIRGAIVPVVSVASNAWIFLLLIGFFFNMMNLVWAAIIMFGCVVIFQLVTLPVEFDASSRALQSIKGTLALPQDQYGGARSVLRSAALTYVASALASILQLLYFIAMARR